MSATPAQAPDRASAPPPDLVIPPRPDVLAKIELELKKDEPDARLLTRWAAQDVGLTAGLLRQVNSPAMGLRRKVDSVDQAVALIGLNNLTSLVTGLCLQQTFGKNGMSLRRFWDVADKRAMAMRRLATRLGGPSPGVAHTFGLFCDVGIPLLMQRFPDYAATLQRCDKEAERPFTAPEQEAYGTDHAVIGSMMARSWGLSPVVHQAIRWHHEPDAYLSRDLPNDSVRLIAMTTLAELAIFRYGSLHASHEWAKTGDRAAGCLVLSDEDVREWVEDLGDMFAQTAS
jgi:HD-like signal output (HDOD) protein